MNCQRLRNSGILGINSPNASQRMQEKKMDYFHLAASVSLFFGCMVYLYTNAFITVSRYSYTPQPSEINLLSFGLLLLLGLLAIPSMPIALGFLFWKAKIAYALAMFLAIAVFKRVAEHRGAFAAGISKMTQTAEHIHKKITVLQATVSIFSFLSIYLSTL
jgi:hypothetical protein